MGGGSLRSTPVAFARRSLNHMSKSSRDWTNIPRALLKSGLSMYATNSSPDGVDAINHTSLSIPMFRSDAAYSDFRGPSSSRWNSRASSVFPGWIGRTRQTRSIAAPPLCGHRTETRTLGHAVERRKTRSTGIGGENAERAGNLGIVNVLVAFIALPRVTCEFSRAQRTLGPT